MGFLYCRAAFPLEILCREVHISACGRIGQGEAVNRGVYLAESPMLDFMPDILMVALALGFFALSIGYVYACDRM